MNTLSACERREGAVVSAKLQIVFPAGLWEVGGHAEP